METYFPLQSLLGSSCALLAQHGQEPSIFRPKTAFKTDGLGIWGSSGNEVLVTWALMAGWWFQTCFMFHFIYGMSSQPHWLPLHNVSRWAHCTTNQPLYTMVSLLNHHFPMVFLWFSYGYCTNQMGFWLDPRDPRDCRWWKRPCRCEAVENWVTYDVPAWTKPNPLCSYSLVKNMWNLCCLIFHIYHADIHIPAIPCPGIIPKWP